MSNRVAIWLTEGIAYYEVVEGDVEVSMIDFDIQYEWADTIVEEATSALALTPDWHPHKPDLVKILEDAKAEVSTNDSLFGS